MKERKKKKGKGRVKKKQRVPAFPTETVHALFKKTWAGRNVKIHKNALLLSGEFLKLFTTEAVHRASSQVRRPGIPEEDSRQIDIEHLESILPQLVLDF
ncbi:hypothetical protein PHYBLDRAFT_188491 [Phycomyces blakesleeanus NRRL 1555(-)]|uniref:Centromere protein X n=2 Tax=Phycomyces blakesleeanus TaxID=4837 RepID=A0A162TIK7_PHYB8|nr:hypothetical protein PHYBLDRAFT_188491 [Phycomyces blakesleeanus NRRL 1555(-)]OAD68882.1 hypothetical protein PHYBLDRAFT_188491 [Phycomyces blakesleeanus NRRL 1555(-)]|eukprot:XP_018286922.1 hypothetical protein PHYBLDRAFT_188491 [Phycomyces blakesleeanus NRRL 1555(-)]